MKKLLTCLIGIILYSSAVAQSSRGSRKFLLRDEGLSQVCFVNLDDSTANWQVKVPPGRDLQLVGKGSVLIGTGNGYQEIDIRSGKTLKEISDYSGSIMARRLKNGNTMLVGLNWENKKGIVLLEVAPDGAKKKVLNFPEYNYVRLVRETPKGTYLITANNVVFESNSTGEIIWKAKLTGPEKIHAWQALRLKKKTVVSTGYGVNFQVLKKDGTPEKIFTGPEHVNPHFFAGFQVLSNGNYLVSNWQGHGVGHGNSGNQLLEFTPNGKLVWSWKQDPAKFSSLQGVLALDGLDPQYLYIEGKNGKLRKQK